MNKKGFTLIELLVAATIIGILTIYATASYRQGVGESRNVEAKGLLDQLASARQRVLVDYPGVKFTLDPVTPTTSRSCGLAPYKQNVNPSQMISCGYLENLAWTGNNYLFYVCDSTSTTCKSGMLACMTGTGKALPKYQGAYAYCVSATTGSQEYGL